MSSYPELLCRSTFHECFNDFWRPTIQKHTAALTAKTERTLAQRAGHLELLKGGKKDEKEAKATGKKVEIRKKD